MIKIINEIKWEKPNLSRKYIFFYTFRGKGPKERKRPLSLFVTWKWLTVMGRCGRVSGESEPWMAKWGSPLFSAGLWSPSGGPEHQWGVHAGPQAKVCIDSRGLTVAGRRSGRSLKPLWIIWTWPEDWRSRETMPLLNGSVYLLLLLLLSFVVFFSYKFD